MTAGKPPGSDDPALDRMTYLPVDRTRARQKVYAAHDPRETHPIGGMRVGQEPVVWTTEDALPALAAEQVASACDDIVAGQGVYPALVYLGRARVGDLSALLAATASEEVRVRWERLWVISPFLARLARADEAVAPLVDLLADDLGAVHLMSKFAEQNNPAVKKLFARLHDPLLKTLLVQLRQDSDDPRRTALIGGIIAAVESREDIITGLLPAGLSELARTNMLDLLYLRPAPPPRKRLRSQAIRERLDRLRR